MGGTSNPYNPPSAPILPDTQPTTPGLWLDGGVLTFFDGTNNNVLDFNEGTQTSLFGTDLGDI